MKLNDLIDSYIERKEINYVEIICKQTKDFGKELRTIEKIFDGKWPFYARYPVIKRFGGYHNPLEKLQETAALALARSGQTKSILETLEKTLQTYREKEETAEEELQSLKEKYGSDPLEKEVIKKGNDLEAFSISTDLLNQAISDYHGLWKDFDRLAKVGNEYVTTLSNIKTTINTEF